MQAPFALPGFRKTSPGGGLAVARDVLECAIALVTEQDFLLAFIGHEQIDEPILIDIGPVR